MFKHFLILIFSILALSIHASKKPKSIDEAVQYFEKKWKKKDIEAYKNMPEDKALTEMDFMVGFWIRNEWVRFPKDTSIRSQFHAMGITHADDMSDIILTCLHRKLNNKPFEIEKQVEQCKAYWTPIRECEARAKDLALGNYDKFAIGDSITIFLFVEKLVGRNGILIQCPDNDWSFDYKKDLIVKGIVSEKYLLYGDPHFKVQVASMNFEDTRIFYKTAKPNDIVEFPLTYLLVKQPVAKPTGKKRK